MEKEVVKNHHNTTNNITTTTTLRDRHIIGEGFTRPPQSADFVLRWGNRKRLRCMKIQVKNDSAPVTRTTVRVDRRVVRSDNHNHNNNNNTTTLASGNHPNNAHFNLRHRPASPAQPPARILRNSEGGSGGMKHNNNNHNTNNNNYNNNNSNGGSIRRLASPETEKKGHENGCGRAASSETKGGGGSSSGGGGGSEMVVWPPKFMIALTNKEKEEDFLAIKGSKLPQRPKKRAKFIQRTLNLMSPGGWLCDLTLDRYEVREKKITKKRPRGLKAMGNYLDSDSD